MARLRLAAALRPACVPIRARSSGSAAFSAAVRVGISWKNWKTMPIVRPAPGRELLLSHPLQALVGDPDRASRGPVDAGDEVDDG